MKSIQNTPINKVCLTPIDHVSVCPGDMICPRCGRRMCTPCTTHYGPNYLPAILGREGECLVCSGVYTEEEINLYPVPIPRLTRGGI